MILRFKKIRYYLSQVIVGIILIGNPIILLHAQESSALTKPSMMMNEITSKDFFKSLQISVTEHPIFLSSEANLAQSRETLNIAKSPRRPQISLFGSTTNPLQSSYDDTFSFFESSPIKDRT